MALTPLSPVVLQEVQTGTTPPAGTPTGPTIYYQTDITTGAVTNVFYWDPVAGWTQLPGATASANWSEGLVCGWDGPHNLPHYAPAHAQAALASVLTPRFSVATPSASAIPFGMWDMSGLAPVLLASGTFPANVKAATAFDCNLVDSASAPVVSFAFVPTGTQPVAQYAAIPSGGHAAMPADGEGFFVHFTQVY